MKASIKKINKMKTIEKISLIIKKLKETKQKVNIKNILTQSLFFEGGTLNENEIKEYLKKESEYIKITKDFIILKNLCQLVNKRHLNGLNDDNQVNELFNFYKGAIGVYIIVAYDNYEAINEEQKEDYIKTYLISTQETENRIIYKTSKGRILVNK